MKDLDSLILQLQDKFKAHANPKEAAGMKKYMKDLFAYLGIKKPIRSELETPFVNECKKLSAKQIEYVAKALWNLPEREFQYTAIVLLRKAGIWKHENSLDLLEWLITHKSWWDTVDAIAAQLVGPYFLSFPQHRDQKINQWKHADNMWLNRSSIIFQLKHKEKTDIPLLFDLLEHFAPQKEFFIKKAVGWALRQLSYTHHAEVIHFCDTHTLQPLSRKEALKALVREGKI